MSTVSIFHYSQSLVFKTEGGGKEGASLCTARATRSGDEMSAASADAAAAAASVDVVGGSSD